MMYSARSISDYQRFWQQFSFALVKLFNYYRQKLKNLIFTNCNSSLMPYTRMFFFLMESDTPNFHQLHAEFIDKFIKKIKNIKHPGSS